MRQASRDASQMVNLCRFGKIEINTKQDPKVRKSSSSTLNTKLEPGNS